MTEAYHHDWARKPPEEWTDQDRNEYVRWQSRRKPLRFAFGHDATGEDVDRFLDQVFEGKAAAGASLGLRRQALGVPLCCRRAISFQKKTNRNE